MTSILTSIKQLLGIKEEDTNFDPELVIHINSVLMILNQLGIGPTTGFRILNSAQTWENFIANQIDIESVKSYVYLKVLLLFDPPQNSFLVDSIKEQCKEYEWRLNVQVENDAYLNGSF